MDIAGSVWTGAWADYRHREKESVYTCQCSRKLLAPNVLNFTSTWVCRTDCTANQMRRSFCCFQLLHLPFVTRQSDAGWDGDQSEVRFKSSDAHPTHLTAVPHGPGPVTSHWQKCRPECGLRKTAVAVTLWHLSAEGVSHGGRLSSASCVTLYWCHRYNKLLRPTLWI